MLPKQLGLSARVRPSTRSRNVPRRAFRSSGMQVTNVPVATATTVRQPAVSRTHVETAREQVGLFSISSTTPVGTGQQYMLNPLTMAGTRLQQLAKSYQKYRFKRAALTIQSSASTSVGGLYVVGYNSNPDAEIGSGFAAVQKTAALPGATSANAWRTVTSQAKIEDPGKWYNLDADSEEVMQTTQGYFSLVTQVPSTGTEPVSYAVWLDYTVEFKGAAINTGPNVVGLFPAGTWTRTLNTRTATFVADAGEPPVPTTANNVTYSVNPGWSLTTFNGDKTTANAVEQSAGSQWSFFESVEGAQTDSKIEIEDSFRTPRTILSSVP